MSEDVIRGAENEVGTIHNKFVDEAEKIFKAKEKEIASA